MRRSASVLALVLAACVAVHTSDAVNCVSLPDVNNYPALNGATIPSSCTNVASGTQCLPECTAGFTSYPDPVLVCGTDGTWTLRDSIGCNPVCPGDPPAAAGVTWVTVNDPAGGGVPIPPEVCTDRIPVYNASTLTIVQCDGICTAGFGSPVAKCERNASTNELQWRVSSVCAAGICNTQPPPFTDGTIWPLSCKGTAVGGKCTGSCRTTPSFWATGNDTDLFPSIDCVEDLSQPTRARWDTANIVGNCVPVCVLPPRIWIRNGSWPEWCDPKLNPETGALTQVGGLTSGQICKGVCLPGYLGSPQWVCSPMGKFKSNRTGDCFPAERGGCWGPLTAPVPLNSKPWDIKCWDMRVGWNCTTQCNGNWNTTITNPATIGFGTAELPYLPHANCVFNASDPYKGSYSEPVGQCVHVCRGPLPTLAGGKWPANCLPINGGYGGLRTNNTRCTSTCDAGFSAANGVTPYTTCSSRGWSPLISACNQDGVKPPEVCAGGVPAPNVAHGEPWSASCANQAPGFQCSTTCVDDPNAALTGSTWGSARLTTPFVGCTTNLTWDAKANGACNKVCATAPPITNGVTWPLLCTRQPGGAGGRESGGVCKGVCAGPNVGIPRVSCTTVPNTGVMAWATPSVPCEPNTKYQGACEGSPNPGPVTNVAGPDSWPCLDLWVGQNCTAICNFGGSAVVTYASGSPTIPPPTVTCQYNATAVPYLGQYSPVITGQCVAVCRNAPPAATGVTWPAMCTPQADGMGGIRTNSGRCNGSCASGYTQTGANPPAITCTSGNWVSLFNPCTLNSGRRLRVKGM